MNRSSESMRSRVLKVVGLAQMFYARWLCSRQKREEK